jgi:HxlR-like helix-turn-helix protein
VARRAYSQRPPRFRYALTEAGQALMPVLIALTAWGDRWATPEGGPPMAFRHRGCGQVFTPVVSCSACGEPLRPGEVDPLPGPGARPGPGTRLVASALARRQRPA